MKLLATLLVALFAASAGPTNAHALDPGYLELKPLGGTLWQVTWRVPDVNGQPMPLAISAPAGCVSEAVPDLRPEGRGWAARWVLDCENGLAGGRIGIDGLSATATDVLVRYGLENGAVPGPVDQTRRLTAGGPAFDIPERQGPVSVLVSYFGLGVVHILLGIDHLAFVLGLLLLIRDRWTLLGAITAFTVAHSITLGAAALGHLYIPSPPVEATIALSIVFLAADVVRKQGAAPTLAQRAPWIVAFGFGLLHGLGFGYALTEVGLPQGAVPLALLGFNMGVEAGQILFVAMVLALVWTVLKVAHRPQVPVAGRVTGAYLIGGLAAYWTIDRVVALVV